MSIQNTRSVVRLYYQGHIILLCYLGEHVVWDGHISRYVPVENAGAAIAAGGPPLVSADTLVTTVDAGGAYVDSWTPTATASVNANPDPASVESEAFGPIVRSDHNLLVGNVASAFVNAHAPTIATLFGISLDAPAAVSVDSFAPTVAGNATVSAPEMATVYVQAYAPIAGSFALVEAVTATVTSGTNTPTVTSTAVVAATAATATAAGLAPTMTADALTSGVTATATSTAYAPEVITKYFSRQRMNKSGNYDPPTSGYARMTGWTSDVTYPATIDTNRLQVVGAGDVTVRFAVNWDTAFSASGTVKIRKNGSEIYSASIPGTDGVYTYTVAQSVVAGDFIEVSVTDPGSGPTVLAAGTYLEIEPV